MEKTDSLLRKALKANGFFSFISAIIALLLGSSIIAVNEMANGQPIVFAIQLFIFGGIVLYAGFKEKLSKGLVWIIIVLDIIYVIMGFLYFFSALANLSTGGKVLIFFTNSMVLSFAIFQIIGIRQYNKNPMES